MFLLDLAARQRKRRLPDEQLTLSMSRYDIANYLGLAAETVSRIISKFERAGLIEVDNRHLHLTDYQALKNILFACEVCSAVSI